MSALRFTLLTLALSWGLAGAAWAAGVKLAGLAGLVVAILYMWVPGIVALSLSRFVDAVPLKESLGLRFQPKRAWLFAALTPGVLAVAAFGLGLLMPGASYDSSPMAMLERYGDLVPEDQRQAIVDQIEALPIPVFWITLVQGTVLGATVNVAASLGEELGWRGYLWRALDGLAWPPRSLVIGLIWGIWHAPLILQGHNYPQHPQLGVGMMVLFCAAVGPVIGWMRERAGDVWAAAIFHGALNGTAGVAILYVRGGDDLHVGVPGLAGILAYSVTALLLALAARPLARPLAEPAE